MRSVLVVDDEAVFARAMRKHLQRAGLQCDVAHSLSDANQYLEEKKPDLVVLDMRLPDGSGLDFLSSARQGALADTPVVVLTAFGDLTDAVTAMKQQAVDYLTKPIDLDNLLDSIERALALAEPVTAAVPSPPVEDDGGPTLLGSSAVMTVLRAQIGRIGALAAAAKGAPPTILIMGETGTGKDLCARALHHGSARREQPFVHLNCAAIARDLIEAELFGHAKGAFTGAHGERAGLLEAAGSGTLFLDEIGELPLDLQSRLLAILERHKYRRVGDTRERAVRAWFIAATNRNLEDMVASGSFREDLYFRLSVLNVSVPALRERTEDVPLLVRHYAAAAAQRYGVPVTQFTDGAMDVLARHLWPGNVRELVNTVDRSVLLHQGGAIGAGDLHLDPSSASGDGTAGADSLEGLTLVGAEAMMIRAALQRWEGNVTRAARDLGVTRMALCYRLHKHAIDPKSFG